MNQEKKILLNDIESRVDYIKKNINLMEDTFRYILFVIKEIFQQIKNINNEEILDNEINTLQEIIFFLQKVVWNKSIIVSKELYRIAKDFDRIDDIENRKILIKKIKDGYYD